MASLLLVGLECELATLLTLSTGMGVRPLVVLSYGIALSAASELNWRERFLRPKIESIFPHAD